ncbi:expressed unknown protein [Ectocarpus siliculosus]|uniref:Uncharacterized protein n=1 Tax=Ectocarpus siliculosus TaxID=2880 RepID=D8LU15_ECTSI|nr:expressed unknown protein [Ectocarpus siliculosus]|eukprot:CBN75405.1 expressed unknown protein [Ectocarpus siliculosus]
MLPGGHTGPNTTHQHISNVSIPCSEVRFKGFIAQRFRDGIDSHTCGIAGTSPASDFTCRCPQHESAISVKLTTSANPWSAFGRIGPVDQRCGQTTKPWHQGTRGGLWHHTLSCIPEPPIAQREDSSPWTAASAWSHQD